MSLFICQDFPYHVGVQWRYNHTEMMFKNLSNHKKKYSMSPVAKSFASENSKGQYLWL